MTKAEIIELLSMIHAEFYDNVKNGSSYNFVLESELLSKINQYLCEITTND